MKPFESFLSNELEAFIAYRISLGYSPTHMRTYLRHLDRYVLKHQSAREDLNPAYFLKFKKSLHYAPKTVNGILSMIRAFFAYLERIERVCENPLKDIPDSPKSSFMPYIFSENDTERLLLSARRRIRNTEPHFFRDYKRYMILMLLARLGLRISEPLRLEPSDFCREDGTIYIRKTKFKKSRRIPIPKSTIRHLENYLSVRNAMDVKSPFLFPGERLEKMHAQSVREAFNRAAMDIGCTQPAKQFHSIRFGRPTPHSLRHAFAINTLKRIREQGNSPLHALPILSVYMGHAHCRYTAVYLKALDAEDRNALLDTAQARWKDR